MQERQETRVALPTRKRNKDEGELDITPMIDIVFLLLAFFVVVSKMDPSTQVMMPVAKYGNTVPEQASVILVVLESQRDEPEVYLGRAKTDENKASGSIEDIENQIAEYIEEALQDPLKNTVIIKAERKVKYRHLDIIKRAVSRSLDEDQIINVGIEEE